MGYTYGRTASGRMALACDNCGAVGGVCRRTCPHKVLGDSMRAVSGKRYAMPYCPAPALCGPCLSKLGGLHQLHRDCAAGAARAQAEYDETQRRLDAGEYQVVAAYGDWHELVPEGMVGVIFGGRDWGETRNEIAVLVPKDAYAPSSRRWLTDYPMRFGWQAPGR